MSIKCYRCGKQGHVSFNCKENFADRSCFLCGETGHLCRECPHELCFNCNLPGHQSRQCKLGKAQSFYCYICKKSGHPPSSECGETRDLTDAFCPNCGKIGHIQSECNSPDMDECNKLHQIKSLPTFNKLMKSHFDQKKRKKN